jgi:hypothetical protein
MDVRVSQQQAAEAFVRSAITGQGIEARLQTIIQEMLSRTRLGELIQRFNLSADGPTSLVVP